MFRHKQGEPSVHPPHPVPGRLLALTTSVLVTSGMLVLAGGAVSEAAPTAAAPSAATPSAATQSAFGVPDRGASAPFTEYEAENAATNGTVIGPDRTFGTLASEASGRKAVTLSGQGRYVEFTLTSAANAIDLHYSIPDSSDGAGLTSPISLYVNGTKVQDLSVTSQYSWYYGAYPFTNNPGDGRQHHFYDDVRALLGTDVPAGAKVRVQVDAGDTAPSYTVDFADFEQVAAPATQPSGSLSVTDYGAKADDATDDSDAFDAAISAARSQGKELWLPQGTFVLNRHITVDDVTLRGAGMWYTVLTGARVGLYGLGEPQSCGSGGNTGTSSNVKLYDFAIIGQVGVREDCDQVNGIGGALGGGSVISGLWIQHTKCGVWMDGPFDGLTVQNNRFLDTTADGLNLHQGISHATVSGNVVRNTGDDGLAMWSENQADHDNTFADNTVQLPNLANDIAIYGGHDNSITGNVVADTVWNGGGIHLANRFNAMPLSGTNTVSGNTAIRAGSYDTDWGFGVGALWFDALNSPISGTVDVTDNDLEDSSYSGLQWVEGGPISGVNFDNLTINGAGTFALQVQTNGSASFKNVVATGIGVAGVFDCQGDGGFTITDQGGNSGYDTHYCGAWPPPVYGGDNGGGDGTNVALHKQVSASASVDGFPAANVVDGDASSYWESANDAFPQTLTVDLGSATSVGKVVLKLPSSWTPRTQTLAVSGSADGSAFTALAASHDYAFDPGSGNTASSTFPATSARYLRLTITANTGWPAGQISEFEAYAAS